jgi:beta-glucosidase
LGGLAFAQDAPAYQDPAKSIDQRVDDVMRRMTFEEKIQMLTVAGPTKFTGIPSLGIPILKASDGPRGPHGPVGYPCGLCLGASFDPPLIKEAAMAMGQECRAKGIGMLFAPAVNIDRDPLGGRFFEYYTEDPYLDARLAVAFVQGLQSRHVVACVKHFACNNRDWNRDNYMSMVDNRVLHEIYFPAFKAAVEEGRALGIMTAANGLNGDYCSDSHFLLTDVLENTWGFNGMILTDGNGTHSAAKAALAGLDISNQARRDESLFGKPLLMAIEAGQVPKSVIDDKVRRILRVMAWAGNLDPGGIKPEGTVDLAAHEKIALRMAEEGLVLLKNDSSVLPLKRSAIKRILVLGPNANQRFCVPGLGGSSWVSSPDEVTVLKGIREAAGTNIEVSYVSRDALGEFEPIDEKYLQTTNGEPGFVANYYNGGINGTPAVTRLERNINFNWEMESPDINRINPGSFSARFSTRIIPPVTGTYSLRVKTDNEAWLYSDTSGAPIAVSTRDRSNGEAIAIVQMIKGKPFFIQVEYHKGPGDGFLSLDWAKPQESQAVRHEMAAVAAQAKMADAVIFVGGIDHSLDAEGRDRLNMDFPRAQRDMINRLSQINPKTIVVLINGSPLTTDGWLENVPAVLDAWYGGSRAGTAVAGALFGDVNPSGKLPFTWPKRLEDSPSHFIGRENKDFVYYKEGIFVGYRYYLTKGMAPEFPFGFGMSYTHFQFSRLRVVENGGRIMAWVDLKNTGQRSGAEVVQLYIHPPKSPVERPLCELKGFQRIFLEPGETVTESLPLEARDFAYYDAQRQAWHVTAGNYKIEIGDSSADVRLTGDIAMNDQWIPD